VSGLWRRLPYPGGVPVLVIAAAVLGTWYLMRLWRGSKGPAAVARVAGVLQVVWKAALVVLALAVVAAMVQGCEGNEGGTGDSGDPRYQPCPAFHEEDCPPAVPVSPQDSP
jgi:hypothetical protein